MSHAVLSCPGGLPLPPCREIGRGRVLSRLSNERLQTGSQ